MKEMWKDIEEYEGSYQVSNFGRVRSLSRWRSDARQNLKPRIMKLFKVSGKYYQVGLYDGGSCKRFGVHRLVAKAFIPNPKDKRTVNHKDNNGFNNHISNLEWATYSENNQHAHDNGYAKAWNKGNYRLYQGNCPQCNNDFEYHRKGQKFCSRPCAARANVVVASKNRWLKAEGYV